MSKFKFIVLSGLLILATYNITKTTLEIYGSSKRLDELKSDLEAKRKENDELKKEYTYKSSDQFVEEEARNKLNFIKPGEKLLIPVSGSEPEVKGELKGEAGVVQKEESNLNRWLKLFFDKQIFFD